ncbi:hypothetical protein [Thermocoleostomius sinensis]|uniref:Uncharacterized protein n=1 Tax=Thermocoleostomius sinensis A174 TaxID=2016057 RepID=A0A9E8ZN75_9CYAN|nr:hypothetical protein [Thermocoleostomius sinensis]WAL61616.1 hypothetical protein OXH18_06420 [Thermocoleostomius sinensis A174]
MNEPASSASEEESQLPVSNIDTLSDTSAPTNEEEILVLAKALARESDTSSAAAAFSSVAGVLGGFSITIVVLALTPGTIVSDSGKDWVVGLVLLSAGLYIYSAGIFANSISFLTKKTKHAVFNVALILFHVSNLLLSVGVLLLTFQFPLHATRVAALIITVFALLVVLSNIGRKVLPILGASILAVLAYIIASLFGGISNQ